MMVCFTIVLLVDSLAGHQERRVGTAFHNRCYATSLPLQDSAASLPDALAHAAAVETSHTLSPMDDADLIHQFEACTLPFDQWTHRTHIKVAFLYLREHGFDGALARLRTGIKAYNAANNVPDGPLMGYNETTTHALLHLIHAVMRAYSETFPTPTADSFCDAHPQLMSKHVLRFFYSPQRRLHPQAKVRFVEPDLAPLPRVVREEERVDFGD
jgi:hypothetical protein